MSIPTQQELLDRFPAVDDPEIIARRRHIVQALLRNDPKMRRELNEETLLEGRLEGQLIAARAALRRVLARRQLTLSQNDDARIEACTELPTLERWLDQAVTAVSVSDALM
jgi:hypothetical protein